MYVLVCFRRYNWREKKVKLLQRKIQQNVSWKTGDCYTFCSTMRRYELLQEKEQRKAQKTFKGFLSKELTAVRSVRRIILRMLFSDA
jgi:hypothetical protein